jgi:hypothetical protein
MWSRIERAVRDAVRAGVALDLSGRSASVRAEVIVELLRTGEGARPGRVARVDLAGARLTGRLDLGGARVELPMRLRQCVLDEPLMLDHAEVGLVELDGCELPAVFARSLQVRRSLAIRRTRVAGGFRGDNLRVTGDLDLTGTSFGGPVNLRRADIGGDAQLGRGATYHAGLRLDGARIANDLDLARAVMRAPEHGPALDANRAVVGGGIWAQEIVADGMADLIGVRASAIAFQHSTLRRHRTLRGPDDAALLLIEAQTALLTIRPAADSAGRIVLRDAHVGRLIDDPVGWPRDCPIELTGLTYERITHHSEDAAEWTVAQRLAWMARYGLGFAPGPYDQLASALQRDGREQEARQVLRVRERLRHRSMGRLGAAWGAVQDAVIGFGYRPARALLWLVAVLAAGSTWFAAGGPLRPVVQGEEPHWDPVLYTLDLLVPLVDLGHERAWDPAGADKAVAVLVMAAGWVLATTVVAGAGRALRR